MNFSAIRLLSDWASFEMLGPELVLILTLALILAVDMLRTRSRPVESGIIAVIGLALAAIPSLWVLGVPDAVLFRGMMIHDDFGGFFKLFAIAAGLIVTVYSLPWVRERAAEFYALLVATVVGISWMASAGNLLMMYLSLELVSIPSYVLAGWAKGNLRSNEASLKYVIFGGAASGAMIYGISLLYGITGSADLRYVGAALAAGAGAEATGALFLATALVLAGIGYKIAAVPFHFWCPDVYEGAPTPVAAFFSVGPKAAGFAMLIRFAHWGYGLADLGGGLTMPMVLAILSAATMTLGNFAALHQTNVKRLLAYSSIGHAGYILMGAAVLNSEAISAMLFYLAVYLFMNLGAFFVVGILVERERSAQIEAFRGLGGREPFLAVSMTIFLFSLTGLPPLAGFVGKFQLFSVVIEDGLYWLAVLGVLNSTVSLYYYARVVKAMFLETAEAGDRGEPLGAPRLHTALAGALAVCTVLFGIFWGALSGVTSDSARSLVAGRPAAVQELGARLP